MPLDVQLDRGGRILRARIHRAAWRHDHQKPVARNTEIRFGGRGGTRAENPQGPRLCRIDAAPLQRAPGAASAFAIAFQEFEQALAPAIGACAERGAVELALFVAETYFTDLSAFDIRHREGIACKDANDRRAATLDPVAFDAGRKRRHAGSVDEAGAGAHGRQMK